MIFITVGTTDFPFDRVDAIVGEVVKKFCVKCKKEVLSVKIN